MTAAKLDLSSFEAPRIPGNRRLLVRGLWYVTSVMLFQHGLALLPSSFKAGVLRAFGAKVGIGVVLKPRLTIKYPWFLSIGDQSWIGEKVWIDNPGRVVIGSNVCVSQSVYIVTGNHDFKDPGFRFFASPIDIGDRSWICAAATIAPGSKVPPGTVVAIGSVWRAKASSMESACLI